MAFTLPGGRRNPEAGEEESRKATSMWDSLPSVLQAQFGTAPRIQLNDTYRTPQDILDFIASERESSTKATAMPCRFVSRPTVIREWVSLPT